MGVQLNIKSEEARRLAEELAAESGETLTKAVTEALRERLEAVRRKRSQTPSDMEERARVLDDIVKGSRALWREDLLAIDHGDMLYDERGLPR